MALSTLVNGQAYDYTQITVTYLGIALVGISSINYTEEQAKENNYGIGTEPVSRGRGSCKYTASMEISMNDIRALKEVAPDKRLTKLPAADIVITYGNPQNVVTDIIKYAEFADDGVETSVDDTDIKRTYNLTIAGIKYSV